MKFKVLSVSLLTSLLVVGVNFNQATVASASSQPASTDFTVVDNEDDIFETMALFIPDRCIYPRTVKKVGSGYYVTVGGGKEYFLDSAAKHGWKNPKVNGGIDVMMSGGKVAGWKVL